MAVSTSGGLADKTVTVISAGANHSCAVAAGGAYCWGKNSSGQLGGNSFWVFKLDSNDPITVTSSGVLSGKTVTKITAGDAHSCVVASSGAYCWGEDGSGQLGNNGSTRDSVSPVAVSIATMPGNVGLISAGTSTTCAVADDKAYCWGANGSGQLGTGDTNRSVVPVAVTANGALNSDKVVGVGVGAAHGCSIAGAAAYCWGSGANGRLGNRSTNDFAYPVAVVADARCASGSVALGDGTCSLAPSTTYFYKVTYTLDGNTATSGALTPLKTAAP